MVEKNFKRILITNDDGVEGEGLKLLVSWARRRFASSFLAVVAPKQQQSGKSASVNIHSAFEGGRISYPDADVAWTIDSTPADCVRFALSLEGDFDLVLSGVNCGYNLGDDIIYSGTCGAIFEAGNNDIHGVAFSTHFEHFEDAEGHMDEVWDLLEERNLLEKCLLWNINFPHEPKGFRFSRQGSAYWHDVFVSDDGGIHYYATGKPNEDMLLPEADATLDTVTVLRDHLISISPFDTKRIDERVLLPLLEENER